MKKSEKLGELQETVFTIFLRKVKKMLNITRKSCIICIMKGYLIDLL